MSQPISTAVSSFNITSPQSQQAPNLMIASPPPSPALQPNNNYSRSFIVVRRVIVAIILLFVLIKVVYFIAWRILHPLPPVFEVKSFNISVTPPNTDYYDIVFTIRNPNKRLSLLMDHFEILVFHGKTRVLKELMPDTAERLCLDKNPVDFTVHRRMHKLESSFWKKRKVNVNVQVSFITRFLAWNWFPKRELTEVYCKDLSARSLSEKQKGGFTGKKEECSVRIV